MRTRSRKSHSSSAPLARGLALLALACNAITGVDDLEFVEPEAMLEPEVVVAPEMTENPQPCSVLTGAGCEAGQTCRLSQEQGAPACLPLAPDTLAPYSACERDTQCPVAHACSAGVCVQLCATESDCGWPNARCSLGGADSLGFGLCSRDCDLANADAPREGRQACGLGTRCDFRADPSGGYTDCVRLDGTSPEGGACGDDGDCAVNLACRDARCERRCDLGVNACSGAATCNGIEDRAGQRVGTCCEIPAGDACDLVSDCGCGAGQTCGWGFDGVAACRTVAAAPLASNAPCTDFSQCPAHHACVSGTCSEQCYTSDDCSVAGSPCQAVSFNDVTIPGRLVCSTPCNPLEPTDSSPGFVACAPQTSCLLFSDGMGGPAAFSCGAVGAALAGDTCATDLDCSSGLWCQSGACTRWCTPDAATCDAGFACGNVTTLAGQQLGGCCALPEGQACDWLSNCGCDADESCAAQNGVRSCRDVADAPVAAYTACNADAQCARAHSCISGVCMPHCATTADCPGDGAACIATTKGEGNDVCTRGCDPLSPQAPIRGVEPCGPGLMCQDAAQGDVAYLMCVAPEFGTVPEGGDCTLEYCLPGLTCSTPDFICAAFCELGTSCGDVDCISHDPPLPELGGRALGYCPIVDDDDD